MTDKQLDTEALDCAITQVEQSQAKFKKVWYALRRIQHDLERGQKLGQYERGLLQKIAHINLIASQIDED